MSAKIEIGIICDEFQNAESFFSILNKLTENLSDSDVSSIADWKWSDYQKYNGKISDGIEAGLIMVYSFNQDLDIGAYQYKNEQGYVTEIWIPAEYIESKIEMTDFLNITVKHIRDTYSEMHVKFAYIGEESYVDYTKDLSEMKEKSSGVIQWIDKGESAVTVSEA